MKIHNYFIMTILLMFSGCTLAESINKDENYKITLIQITNENIVEVPRKFKSHYLKYKDDFGYYYTDINIRNDGACYYHKYFYINQTYEYIGKYWRFDLICNNYNNFVLFSNPLQSDLTENEPELSLEIYEIWRDFKNHPSGFFKSNNINLSHDNGNSELTNVLKSSDKLAVLNTIKIDPTIENKLEFEFVVNHKDHYVVSILITDADKINIIGLSSIIY